MLLTCRRNPPAIAEGSAKVGHFLDPPPVLPDVVLDYGVLTLKPALVPQPLEDALGRVSLLSGNLGVGLQDRVNYAGVGLKLRPAP